MGYLQSCCACAICPALARRRPRPWASSDHTVAIMDRSPPYLTSHTCCNDRRRACPARSNRRVSSLAHSLTREDHGFNGSVWTATQRMERFSSTTRRCGRLRRADQRPARARDRRLGGVRAFSAARHHRFDPAPRQRSDDACGPPVARSLGMPSPTHDEPTRILPDYREDFPAGSTRESGRLPVMCEAIIDFARQWDPQPSPTSTTPPPSVSSFGRLSASGRHRWAMVMRTMRVARLLYTRASAARGSKPQRLKPVYPCDTLRGRLTLLESRPMNSKPRWAVMLGAGSCSISTTKRCSRRSPRHVPALPAGGRGRLTQPRQTLLAGLRTNVDDARAIGPTVGALHVGEMPLPHRPCGRPATRHAQTSGALSARRRSPLARACSITASLWRACPGSRVETHVDQCIAFARAARGAFGVR